MHKNSMGVSFVNLAQAYVDDSKAILAAIEAIGTSGNFILGNNVKSFEKQFSEYVGSDFAIGVANGSDALFLIMKALGIGPGDEVITAPNSFIASAWTIVATGAKPVFCDVDGTLNLDPEQLESKITARTKAIMPVHLAGNPANMLRIRELAKVFSLHIIEDAAQAVGAKYRNEMIGSLGDAAAFSLHPLKNLGVLGDGGVITTSDPILAQEIIKLRNHGLVNRDDCEIWGYNSRLDEIQAAIALIRLEKIEPRTQRVREIASRYSEELSQIVETPVTTPNSYHVFHNYIIQLEMRDELASFLLENNIETRTHYPVPIHLQPAAKDLGYKEGDFPVSEYQSSNSLSLPIYPELLDEQVDYIIATTKRFFEG